MIGLLIGQIELMSLAEGLHTAAFTVFILSGVVCCFRRTDIGRVQQPPARPQEVVAVKISAPPRRRRSTRAAPTAKPRPRQLQLPLRRAA